jgi:hypothetical protein
MTNQLFKYLSLALAILLIALSFWFLLSTKNKDKKINELSLKLNDCVNAPLTRDTVWKIDTVYLPAVTYHPVPKKVIEQTISVNNLEFEQLKRLYYTQKHYEESIVLKDVKLKWKAVVSQNNLDEISFPEYIITRPEITITKTVDTCFRKKPEYYPKNHLGMDINLIGSNIKQFPNMDATFFWSIKDKWKINIGAEYNTYHSELYGKIGIGIYFK